MKETENPYSPERLAKTRQIEANFRRAIERGEITGDVVRDDPTEPLPSPADPEPVRFPLRKLKEPPADGDR